MPPASRRQQVLPSGQLQIVPTGPPKAWAQKHACSLAQIKLILGFDRHHVDPDGSDDEELNTDEIVGLRDELLRLEVIDEVYEVKHKLLDLHETSGLAVAGVLLQHLQRLVNGTRDYVLSRLNETAQEKTSHNIEPLAEVKAHKTTIARHRISSLWARALKHALDIGRQHVKRRTTDAWNTRLRESKLSSKQRLARLSLLRWDKAILIIQLLCKENASQQDRRTIALLRWNKAIQSVVLDARESRRLRALVDANTQLQSWNADLQRYVTDLRQCNGDLSGRIAEQALDISSLRTELESNTRTESERAKQLQSTNNGLNNRVTQLSRQVGELMIQNQADRSKQRQALQDKQVYFEEQRSQQERNLEEAAASLGAAETQRRQSTEQHKSELRSQHEWYQRTLAKVKRVNQATASYVKSPKTALKHLAVQLSGDLYEANAVIQRQQDDMNLMLAKLLKIKYAVKKLKGVSQIFRDQAEAERNGLAGTADALRQQNREMESEALKVRETLMKIREKVMGLRDLVRRV